MTPTPTNLERMAEEWAMDRSHEHRTTYFIAGAHAVLREALPLIKEALIVARSDVFEWEEVKVFMAKANDFIERWRNDVK